MKWLNPGRWHPGVLMAIDVLTIAIFIIIPSPKPLAFLKYIVFTICGFSFCYFLYSWISGPDKKTG